MRGRARFACLVLVAAAVGGTPRTAAADPRPCPASSPAASGRLVQLDVSSAALGRTTRACVLLPRGYASTTRAYPVLYLLHGAGDDHASWMDLTDVEELTDGLDLIVVMPDAGKAPDAGWYSDWACATSPCAPGKTPPGPAWESYHVGELIPLIDGSYRTAASRAGRAVAGLSMGGFGAMSYAARHPGLFGVAASFSGAVDSADGSVAQAEAYRRLHDSFGTPDDRVWGEYRDHEVRWRDHNPPDLSPNIRQTLLWLSTGNGVPMPGDSPTGSPVEAGVYAQNLAFHADLVAEGIDHVWRDRGFGTHSWNYWEADLHAFTAELLMPVFDGTRPLPGGTAFDYRSARPRFDAWGWSFDADRDAVEFLEITGAGASGARLRGTGTVAVRTGPLYPAGSWRRVRVSMSPLLAEGYDFVYTVQADGAGRLAFDVDLGPSHAAQQYTVGARVAEATGGPDYWRTATVQITPL